MLSPHYSYFFVTSSPMLVVHTHCVVALIFTEQIVRQTKHNLSVLRASSTSLCGYPRPTITQPLLNKTFQATSPQIPTFNTLSKQSNPFHYEQLN